jgi:putative intracellular protease/amidase
MPLTVYLYVLDTLADWEPGFAIANINNPGHQKIPGRYQVRTVGLSTQPVTTAGGVRIIPDLALSQVKPSECAMLILPGGDSWDEGKNMEAVEKAKELLEAGVPVAAICGATSGLARGGILDTRSHTSNAPEYLAATGYRGGHLYRHEAAVTDQNVITASAMKSLDFAYHICKRLDLYEDRVLDAWYGLFKTGDAKYYAELVAMEQK